VDFAGHARSQMRLSLKKNICIRRKGSWGFHVEAFFEIQGSGPRLLLSPRCHSPRPGVC